MHTTPTSSLKQKPVEESDFSLKVVMMKTSLAFGAMLLLLVSASKLGAAITCPEAIKTLSPCLQYLRGAAGDQPTEACCTAVKSVNDLATTRQARSQVRRDLCNCLQPAAKILSVEPDKAKAIPGLCHVRVPVPPGSHIYCNSIP